MTTRMKLLIGGIATLLVMGCISETTGRKAAKVDTTEASTQYYTLGAKYYRNGQYDLAEERLRRSLDFDPKNAIAHSVLALTYRELEIPRLAAEHFELAVRYGPNNIDVRNTYAVFLCQERRFDDARAQFESIVTISENDDPEIMLTNAGVCMAQKPDLVDAEQYFRRALSEKPAYAEALLQMTLLKWHTQESLSARAFLQRYLGTSPPSAAILFIAIQIENDLGNARASTNYSNQLLRDFPASPEARSMLEAG